MSEATTRRLAEGPRPIEQTVRIVGNAAFDVEPSSNLHQRLG
jgi:hypothetical protein